MTLQSIKPVLYDGGQTPVIQSYINYKNKLKKGANGYVYKSFK